MWILSADSDGQNAHILINIETGVEIHLVKPEHGDGGYIVVIPRNNPIAGISGQTQNIGRYKDFGTAHQVFMRLGSKLGALDANSPLLDVVEA